MTTSTPTSDPATRRRRPWRFIVLAAAAIIVLAAAGFAVAVALAKPDPTDPMSRLAPCREQVREMTRTSTTKFAGDEKVDASTTQSTIVGKFDAQDRVGRLTTFSYRCMLVKDKAGHFQIYDVTIS